MKIWQNQGIKFENIPPNRINMVYSKLRRNLTGVIGIDVTFEYEARSELNGCGMRSSRFQIRKQRAYFVIARKSQNGFY